MADKLTQGSLLARNTIYNLLGYGLPLILLIFIVPLLIHKLGTDRFGILTLALTVIGYSSLFDLGLGRALTQLLAKKRGYGENEQIPSIVWTSLCLMFGLGILGTLIVSLITHWLVYQALKIPSSLQTETLISLYLISAILPIFVSKAGLKGILTAHQRFDLVNFILVPIALLTLITPLLVLNFSHHLAWIIGSCLAIQLLEWLGYFYFCCQLIPALRQGILFQPEVIYPLLKFGGWMTITNIIGPLMVYLDRFFIGALLSTTLVAYYTTPYEVVTKLWIVPSALVSVLFPAFSTSFVQNTEQTAAIFKQSVKYIFLLLFPVVLTIVSFASFGLNIWLGQDFAINSTPVLQWLAVGVLINSLAQVPFGLIQGIGKPDITAKFHLVELPFYLVSLWYLVPIYGIKGAAIAWVVRILVDTVFLFSLVPRFLPIPLSYLWQITFTLVMGIMVIAIASLWTNELNKILFLGITLFSFGLFTWFVMLTKQEKVFILRLKG